MAISVVAACSDGTSRSRVSSGKHDAGSISQGDGGSLTQRDGGGTGAHARPDASAAARDGGGDTGGPTCKVGGPPNREPGRALADRAAVGTGACAGTSLGSVIDAVHAAHPEFADVQDLFAPNANGMGDHSFVYAFATADGAFALVFRRGGGDCPAGCTENEYWYFRTDSSCAPKAIGHFLPLFDPAGCLALEGFPLWDHPPPPDPTTECNMMDPPIGFQGQYSQHVCGQSQACSDKRMSQALDFELQFRMKQSDTAPSTGSVWLDNTGWPELDDRPLAATFVGSKLHVLDHKDNLPANCIEQQDLEVVIDFSGHVPSFVHYSEVKTPDCATAPGVYCKGSLDLDLGNLNATFCAAPEDVLDVVARIRSQPATCKQDMDCALLAVDAECAHACPVAVRADQIDAQRQLFQMAAAAYCQDTGCSLGQKCTASGAVCTNGTCTVEGLDMGLLPP